MRQGEEEGRTEIQAGREGRGRQGLYTDRFVVGFYLKQLGLLTWGRKTI